MKGQLKIATQEGRYNNTCSKRIKGLKVIVRTNKDLLLILVRDGGEIV